MAPSRPGGAEGWAGARGGEVQVQKTGKMVGGGGGQEEGAPEERAVLILASMGFPPSVQFCVAGPGSECSVRMGAC